MSESTRSDLVREAGTLPGSSVVARIRQLVIVAVVAAAVYAVFMTASKGYCPGGVTANGAFIDAHGNVVAQAPTCINLILRPSGLVFLAIAAIVIVALTMVLRRAVDEPSAMKYLNRGATLIAIVAVASFIIGQVWFALIPITDWGGSGTFYYPFPFGEVELETHPMNVP